MSDMFEDAAHNQPEFTVSELSGAVKRVIEGEFGLVRVRGEVGRVTRHASGHVYFALKDDRATLDSVSWKGQVSRLKVRPEEGMEVIATGRMTTFPGSSKYQLIVEDLVLAGAGALMAMLEKRKASLGAEGLFDPARKQAIPYLPAVIGVVTSPSGAVIRDILHRLRDRFPRHVLIWPVAVQGQSCAAEVSAAIRGFNAISAGGAIPRPDLIIVARGGGSLEDLWGFNEEIVVRAAADSRIPLISAVGHETDTTLIDYAADLRAPTPTAAAELAVPVRADLRATLDALVGRQSRATANGFAARAQRLRDLARALPRVQNLLERPNQRFDQQVQRLGGALGMAAAKKRTGFGAVAGRLRGDVLAGLTLRKREALVAVLGRVEDRYLRRKTSHAVQFDKWASRLSPALARMLSDAAQKTGLGRGQLAQMEARLQAAPGQRLALLSARLDALDRMRQTLGYRETLTRGYAVVRGGAGLITRAQDAKGDLEIEFADGRVKTATAESGKKPGKPVTGQGSLF